MYYIFRCDCGRVLYAKKGVATRKCTCGKTLKVKSRRILQKVDTIEDATYAVHEVGGKWVTASNNSQAGKNPIDGVAIKGGVEYRVHILGGGWLEPVHKYDLNDAENGFAGILGQTIDAVAIKGKTYASGYFG